MAREIEVWTWAKRVTVALTVLGAVAGGGRWAYKVDQGADAAEEAREWAKRAYTQTMLNYCELREILPADCAREMEDGP